MRQVLFKAKRIDNGEWVCWNLYGELCRLSGKRTRLAIKNGSTTHYYDYIYQVIEQIDKNTICQYTGLTDKNGNKIWENDIVMQTFYKIYEMDYGMDIGKVTEEIDGNETGVVTITASKGVCIKRPYQNVWINGELERSNQRLDTNKNVVSYRSEVIRNIFDNLELLQ